MVRGGIVTLKLFFLQKKVNVNATAASAEKEKANQTTAVSEIGVAPSSDNTARQGANQVLLQPLHYKDSR